MKMAWDELHYHEDVLRKMLTEIQGKIAPIAILSHIADRIPARDVQHIERTCDRRGDIDGAYELVNVLLRLYPDDFIKFVEALWKTGVKPLAIEIYSRVPDRYKKNLDYIFEENNPDSRPTCRIPGNNGHHRGRQQDLDDSAEEQGSSGVNQLSQQGKQRPLQERPSLPSTPVLSSTTASCEATTALNLQPAGIKSSANLTANTEHIHSEGASLGPGEYQPPLETQVPQVDSFSFALSSEGESQVSGNIAGRGVPFVYWRKLGLFDSESVITSEDEGINHSVVEETRIPRAYSGDDEDSVADADTDNTADEGADDVTKADYIARGMDGVRVDGAMVDDGARVGDGASGGDVTRVDNGVRVDNSVRGHDGTRVDNHARNDQGVRVGDEKAHEIGGQWRVIVVHCLMTIVHHILQNII